MPQKTENGSTRIMEDFSELFTPAIAGVVQFARRIPGFAMLSQDDQATLLKVSFPLNFFFPPAAFSFLPFFLSGPVKKHPGSPVF